MNSFKEDLPCYNWEHSKGYSVFECLCIHIKTFDDGGLQFYQTGVIKEVLEATGMEHCNQVDNIHQGWGKSWYRSEWYWG